MTVFKDFIIPLLTLIALVVTFIIYIRILKVSKDTLEFTKNKSSFNTYFDNYKLFLDLSKKEIDIVIDAYLYDDQEKYFNRISFENLHQKFIQILQNFPLEGKTVEYSTVFKRLNIKIHSFIDTIYNEIIRIKKDDNLNVDDKKTMIILYKDFLLYDYMNLCFDLKQNKELNEQGLPPTEVPDYLKCNYYNKKNFDIDSFLKLYNELGKISFENQ